MTRHTPGMSHVGGHHSYGEFPFVIAPSPAPPPTLSACLFSHSLLAVLFPSWIERMGKRNGWRREHKNMPQ